MTNKICKSCNRLKKHYATGLCYNCYKKQYRVSNREKLIEKEYGYRGCKILKNHADDLKNDSERLPTSFILREIEKHRRSKS